MRLSPPAAGLLVGFLTGAADAVIVHTNPPWAFTMQAHVAPFTWAGVIWTWMTVCCLAGVIFSSPRLGRLRAIPLTLAGPALLLLSRVAGGLKESAGLSTSGVLAMLFGATIVIGALIALVPLADQGNPRRYLAATVASAIAIALCGSHAVLPAAGTPRASKGPQRNVVLIVLDTVRYDDALAMPHLAAFSKQAVTFDNAWAPAPWTIPSHFAMLTGVEPWLASYDPATRHFTHSAPSLPVLLERRGYDSQAVYGNYLLTGAGFSKGFDRVQRSRDARVCSSGIANLAFRAFHHDLPRISWCGVLTASEVTARARRFVARAERPYFLAVNYMDAHDPYYVEPRCRDAAYRPAKRAVRKQVTDATPARPPTPEAAQRTRADYRKALQCLDRSVAELLGDVDANSVIAIAGDHGEQFGEHGFGWHGNSLYRQLLHVPLIVKAPGLTPARVAEPVSLSDLSRTLLTLADPSRGRALPLFDPRLRRTATAIFKTEKDGGVSVTRGHHHFIRWLDGREALYDYHRDPEETRPLSDETIAAPLRAIAMKIARSPGVEADFRALGYLR